MNVRIKGWQRNLVKRRSRSYLDAKLTAELAAMVAPSDEEEDKGPTESETNALMERIGTGLPGEVREQPPERYAAEYETIVRYYVESLDRVRRVLRNL